MAIGLSKNTPLLRRKQKSQQRGLKGVLLRWWNLSPLILIVTVIYSLLSNWYLSHHVIFFDFRTIINASSTSNFLLVSSSNNTGGSSSTTTTTNIRRRRRRIYRYDDAGIQPIPGWIRSHRLPNAIPSSRTIPSYMATNKTYHLLQRQNTSTLSVLGKPQRKDGRYNWNNHNYQTDFRTLYYFNPAILPLFRNTNHNNNNNNQLAVDKNNTAVLPAEKLKALTGDDESVKYVVLYETYLGSNCFGPDPKRELMVAGERLHYTAIALMDEQLNLIPNTDILIDLNVGPTYGKYFRQFQADCRIFAMRGNILLTCMEQLHHIELIRQRRRRTTANNGKNGNDPHQDFSHYATNDNHSSLPYLYPNMYGDGMRVILHSSRRKIGGGKNFQLFSASSTTSNGGRNTNPSTLPDDNDEDDTFEYYVQLDPIPHKYRRIALPASNETELHPYPPGPEFSEEYTSTTPIPPESFATIDALHPIRTCPKDTTSHNDTQDNGSSCTNPIDTPFWKMHHDHGTACCISVDLPVVVVSQQQSKKATNTATTTTTTTTHNNKNHHEEESVWVGISHNKLSTKDNFWKQDILHRYDNLLKDQYVSRFVAYSKIPPFDIVAVSGWFCLGHYSYSSEKEEDDHATTSETTTATLAGRHNYLRLSLFNETFNCPPIHFPSAFTEFVGDSSKAIIGYGVNDCYPMLIVVKKQDIVTRLLGRGF